MRSLDHVGSIAPICLSINHKELGQSSKNTQSLGAVCLFDYGYDITQPRILMVGVLRNWRLLIRMFPVPTCSLIWRSCKPHATSHLYSLKHIHLSTSSGWV